MVSTKGRYALRILSDIAVHSKGEYLSVKEIAERQEISAKYLEAIVAILCKAGLLSSKRGKNGGYRLAQPPDSCTVGSVLRLTEGSMAPVACMRGKNPCHRAARCQALPMWKELGSVIETYLETKTIADLIRERSEE